MHLSIKPGIRRLKREMDRIFGRIVLSGDGLELTNQELIYLFKIGTCKKPSGIIDNSINEVLIRNQASINQLREWGVSIPNTKKLWDIRVLAQIQEKILSLQDGESFEQVHQMIVPRLGVLLITSKFTRLTYKNRICRVFEQLECEVIR